MSYLVEFTAEATADLEALAPIIQERILLFFYTRSRAHYHPQGWTSPRYLRLVKYSRYRPIGYSGNIRIKSR
jgi:hypothetical protein